MDAEARERVLGNLRDALKALALSGEMQLDMLPCFTCCAPYLVRQYEAACTKIRWNISEEFTPYIDARHQELLDILASQFSNVPGDVSHGWIAQLEVSDQNHLLGSCDNSFISPKAWMTDEAVMKGFEWQNIRRTAIMVLKEFDWTLGPPSSWYSPLSVTLNSNSQVSDTRVRACPGYPLEAEYNSFHNDESHSSYYYDLLSDSRSAHYLTVEEAEKKSLIAVLNKSLARPQRNLSNDAFLLELIWLSCPSWFQLHKCLYDNAILFEMWW